MRAVESRGSTALSSAKRRKGSDECDDGKGAHASGAAMRALTRELPVRRVQRGHEGARGADDDRLRVQCRYRHFI